ncbi:MAG: hypothetical protein NTZ95_04465 [Candidatus Omnitrophica bacterium]|nr:hypothetical protein [Candidatus Omnitrophota bacterium]
MAYNKRVRGIWRLPVFMLAASLSLSACAKSKALDKDIIAYVNKDPIYKSDLKRDIALRAKFDPEFKLTPESESEQLDAMIDRKIIVQYAMEKGLAREERFVATIRTIWEHTLIRDFIEYKKKQLQDYLFATNEDIKKYYDNMSYKVTFKVFKSRNKSIEDAAYAKYLKDKDTSSWQVVGPIGYDDVGPIPLLDAFEMGEGEVGRFADEPSYYIIEVSKKEKVEIVPLETIKGEVEKRVVSMEEKRLFEEWLKEEKKASKITIKAD